MYWKIEKTPNCIENDNAEKHCTNPPRQKDQPVADPEFCWGGGGDFSRSHNILCRVRKIKLK